MTAFENSTSTQGGTNVNSNPSDQNLETGWEYPKNDNPNVVLTTAEGTKTDFNSPNYQQQNQEGTESKISYFAAGDAKLESAPPLVLPPNEERATSEMRQIWGINTRQGEKPSEVIKDVRKYPDAKELEKASKEYSKDRESLDDADRKGIKQSDQGVFHEAELVKINNHLKEYDESLRKGRELKDNEIKLLRDQYFEKLPRYSSFKASYDSKNLTQEDREILLKTHFAQEINDFDSSLKNAEGKFSSEKCNLKQLGTLYDIYEKDLISEHVKDRKAREQESGDDDREKRMEEYKKWFEDTYGIPWSVEAAKLMQERDNLKTERDLFKEDKKIKEERFQTNKDGGKKEGKDTEGKDTEGKDDEADKERRERNLKRLSLVAGVVSGVGTGLLVSSGAIVPVAVTVAASNLVTFGTDAFAKRGIEKIGTRLSNKDLSLEDRTKLEKRKFNLEKLRKGLSYIKPFIGGFGGGFAASALFRSVFMAGQSLIQKFGNTGESSQVTTSTESTQETPTNTESSKDISNQVSTETGTSVENLGSEAITEDVLVSNGRVNLPGSAWNGNLAGDSVGTLQGGALNHSNYTGGVYEMAPNLAEQALKQAGITRNVLLDNLGTDGTHRLLYNFVTEIQSGNANPTLTSVLSKMQGEGVENLLKIINK